jgi:hypothetical protein
VVDTIAGCDMSVQWRGAPWIAAYYIQKGGLRREFIPPRLRILDLQPHGQDVIGERRRQGTLCVTVDLSQSDRDTLVVRDYLSEEDRDNDAAIKKAIEGLISDLVFELQSETAERCGTRV